MKKGLLILLVSFSAVVFVGNQLIYSEAAEEHHGHHEAHHGGVLNVIGEEAGHISRSALREIHWRPGS